MATTPIYNLPYQTLLDAPDGPDLGEDLAKAVESELVRIDSDVDALQATAGKAPVTTVFTAAGTWTKPSDALFIRVVAIGGGGGGGGCPAGTGGVSEGGGGGGGGYAESILWASAIPNTISVTVGAGGAGNTGAGGTGGNSTFGSFLTAFGGSGGAAGPAAAAGASSIAAGGTGGSATGGNIKNVRGGTGSHGRVINGLGVLQNRGGSSLWGGEAAARTGVGDGPTGISFGGGGSGGVGGTSAANGGAGAAGVVIITIYY